MTCRSRRKQKNNRIQTNQFEHELEQQRLQIQYSRYSALCTSTLYSDTFSLRQYIFSALQTKHFYQFDTISFHFILVSHCIRFNWEWKIVYRLQQNFYVVRVTCCYCLSLNRCRSSYGLQYYGESLPSSSPEQQPQQQCCRRGCLFIVAVSCDMRYVNRIQSDETKIDCLFRYWYLYPPHLKTFSHYFLVFSHFR